MRPCKFCNRRTNTGWYCSQAIQKNPDLSAAAAHAVVRFYDASSAMTTLRKSYILPTSPGSNEKDCTGCEVCIDRCQMEAIEMKDGMAAVHFRTLYRMRTLCYHLCIGSHPSFTENLTPRLKKLHKHGSKAWYSLPKTGKCLTFFHAGHAAESRNATGYAHGGIKVSQIPLCLFQHNCDGM